MNRTLRGFARVVGPVLVMGASGAADAQLIPHKDISLAMAITAAQAAMDTCKSQGHKVSVHVVGRNGETLVGLRGDGSGPHSYESAQRKAYTSRTFGMSSGKFADLIKEKPTLGLPFISNIISLQGGLPIMVGDDVVGAVAVAGTPSSEVDEACAKAGLDKIANQLK